MQHALYLLSSERTQLLTVVSDLTRQVANAEQDLNRLKRAQADMTRKIQDIDSVFAVVDKGVEP